MHPASACVSLGYVLSLLLVEPAKEERSRCIPQPGQRPQDPKHWAGPQHLHWSGLASEAGGDGNILPVTTLLKNLVYNYYNISNTSHINTLELLSKITNKK